MCIGPKNNAYHTHQHKKVCKVKGFSLNYANLQVINLESMKDVMFNRDDSQMNYLTVNPSKICRDKLHSEIYSQEEVKKYQGVDTKRVIKTDLFTVSCGF